MMNYYIPNYQMMTPMTPMTLQPMVDYQPRPRPRPWWWHNSWGVDYPGVPPKTGPLFPPPPKCPKPEECIWVPGKGWINKYSGLPQQFPGSFGGRYY